MDINNPPDGFVIAPYTHIVKDGDLYFGGFTKSWCECGSTIGKKTGDAICHAILAIATKSKTEIRFKNSKPYPFGY